MTNVRAHIFVSGRVQGIFFRNTMRRKAKLFGVYGWVRNLPDGRVEATLEGTRERVQKLIEWAKRGPFLARVSNIEIKWEKYQGEFEGFEIRY